MKHFIQKHLWFLILNIILITIAVVNFPVNKYFVGWDSLNTDLNPSLNLIRAVTPFWQENYGLGALTGHGFAGTLPHVLISGLLTKILPTWAVRSVFTFLCYYLGGIGIFFLLKYFLRKLGKENSSPIYKYIPVISFLGSTFYLLNLGTAQVFYIQLEAFIAQFASLPWLILCSFYVLDGKKNAKFFLFLIGFASSIQGFIPSLFISYFVSLLILVISFISFNRNFAAIKRGIFTVGILLLSNILWLMPLVYFQLTRGASFLASFNNISSTPHFVELSSKYGNLSNVALLKSYLFDSYELGDYILQPWIMNLNHLNVQIIGYLLFALIISGLILSLVKLKNYYSYFFALSFIYFFASIAVNTFPFNILTKIGQMLSPTYEQAFRTTFTKFGIGMSFLYSVELAIFIFLAMQIVLRMRNRLVSILLPILIFLMIGWFAQPIIKGHLLYNKLQLEIPRAYFDLSSYMNSKPDGRIADFPQYCETGWYAYNWGYFGSGFLWYSIKQPFLSRTFDVWNNNGENYYWEISQALNQRDYAKAKGILNKYSVDYVVFDPNEISCSSQKGIIENKEFIEYLKNNGFNHEQKFSNGVSYSITLLQNPNTLNNSFISIKEDLPNVGPVAHWIDSDASQSDYLTNDKSPFDFYFPFRSLLTKRGAGDESVPTIREVENNFILTSTLPAKLDGSVIKIPPIKSTEKTVAGIISAERNDLGIVTLYLKLTPPSVTIGDQQINSVNKFVFGEFIPSSSSFAIYSNGQRLEEKNGNFRVILSTTSNNLVEVLEEDSLVYSWNSDSDSNFMQDLSVSWEQKLQLSSDSIITVSVPQITDNNYHGSNTIDMSNQTPVPCNEKSPTNKNIFEASVNKNDNFIRLISDNSSQCLNIRFQNTITDQSYILSVKSKNVSGNLPKTSLSNNGSLIYSSTNTGEKNKLTKSFYVIPSSSSGSGYDAVIENISESKKSINDIYNVSLYPLPYDFIKNIYLTGTNSNKTPKSRLVKNVKHSNPTTYEVGSLNNSGTLVLSQSYDTGWKAYEVNLKNVSSLVGFFKKSLPFIFGKELKNHYKVNNWANGWEITDSNSEVIIVYLPQYLEYLGFVIFILPLLFFPIRKAIKLGHKADAFFATKAAELKRKIEILRQK